MMVGLAGAVLRNKVPSARERALLWERYDASLWKYKMVASGWVAQYYNYCVMARAVALVPIRAGGSDRAEGDEHGRVHGMSVVEKCADDFLELLEAVGIEWGQGVNGGGELGGGAIDGFEPGMGRVLLPAGCRMAEMNEHLLNVLGHGDYVNCLGSVIPIKDEVT
jgi:hypothetical protein